MTFRVSGKNLDVGDALRDRVSERIAEAMGKYFDGGYSGHVTLEREGFGFRTECAVHLELENHSACRGYGGRRLHQRRPGSDCESRNGCAAIIAG